MEVKVGVQNVPRELVLESTDSAEQIAQLVATAMADDDGVLTLTDEKGRRILVPADKIAYIELGEPQERRVGFGAM